jgi:hypothetical protein
MWIEPKLREPDPGLPGLPIPRERNAVRSVFDETLSVQRLALRQVAGEQPSRCRNARRKFATSW